MPPTLSMSSRAAAVDVVAVVVLEVLVAGARPRAEEGRARLARGCSSTRARWSARGPAARRSRRAATGLAVVVDEARRRSRAPACRWCRSAPRRPVREEDVQHLGRADAVEDVDAEALAPALADVARAAPRRPRCSGATRSAARRGARAGEHRGVERRHAVEDRRPVLLQHRGHRRPASAAPAAAPSSRRPPSGR